MTAIGCPVVSSGKALTRNAVNLQKNKISIGLSLH
jgi:hypothetical protein